jgi:hypothetical protein
VASKSCILSNKRDTLRMLYEQYWGEYVFAPQEERKLGKKFARDA